MRGAYMAKVADSGRSRACDAADGLAGGAGSVVVVPVAVTGRVNMCLRGS